MKKKTKRTLIVLLCILLFLAAAGFAAYNIGLRYVEKKMISSVVESMIDKGEITLSEIEAITGTEAIPPADTDTPQENGKETEAAESTTEKNETEASVGKEPVKKNEPEKKKETVSEETRTEAVDKFTEKIINSLSREEKLAMVRLITSHLSSGDITYLASLLAGGLTREERAAAYKLATQRFSADELGAVRNYYHRYKAQIMIEPDYPTKK